MTLLRLCKGRLNQQIKRDARKWEGASSETLMNLLNMSAVRATTAAFGVYADLDPYRF